MDRLTANDIDDMKIFADREILAGRWLMGRRLHAVLSTLRPGPSSAGLLAENEADAMALRDELGQTRNDVATLQLKLNSMLEGLGAVLSRAPATTSTRNAVALEATRAFHDAISEIVSDVSKLAARIDIHRSTANDLGTPLEEMKAKKP